MQEKPNYRHPLKGELYPKRPVYVEGQKAGLHRFVEDHSTVSLCGTTSQVHPIKGLCEFEDGTIKLVPIEQIVFCSNEWMADMAWLRR